jgi:hypothetical protein
MSQRKALLVALYLAAHGRFATGVQILNSQPKLRFHIEDALRTTRWEFFTSALFVSVDRYKSKSIAHFTYKVPGSYHLCVASPSVLHRALAITVILAGAP